MAALLLTSLSLACVIGYEVAVTNRLGVPVVVELSQYRAEDGRGTPPKEFMPDLLVETRVVSLDAGESTKVDFNSAAGGFWVRWRLVGSPARESEAATLDLLRNRLSIVVSEDATDPAARGGSGVAARHLKFARGLTTANMRLSSSEFQAIASAIEDGMCNLTTLEEKIPAGLEEMAQAYADDFCAPWMDLWRIALEDCGDPECDEARVLARLDLDGYFASLAAGIGASRDDLERENIMDMVLGAFSAHVMTDLGEEPVDRWATAAATAYIGAASCEQVIDFARTLQRTWVGLTPGVAARIKSYAGAADGLSSEQRWNLEALVEKRFSDD